MRSNHAADSQKTEVIFDFLGKDVFREDEFPSRCIGQEEM